MAIDLADYSRTSAQRKWGPGWPSCDGARNDVATVVTARSGTRLVTRKRLARLVQVLVDWTEDPQGGNYRLDPTQCGGYNCRQISGTRVASNHSWAVAFDFNWNRNPYTTTGKHDIPDRVYDTWGRYGFANGGDYKGARKDWMHFEFMGTPADAEEMTQLAIREILGGQLPAGRPTLQKGDKGPAVRELQGMLKINVDGVFGDQTDRAVRDFQARNGLTVDGVVGLDTWRALEKGVDIMASVDELRVLLREEMQRPIKREGEGQTGETSKDAVAARTDAAWSIEIANSVWDKGLTNAFGESPSAAQIISATEGRIAKIEIRLDELHSKMETILAKLDELK